MDWSQFKYTHYGRTVGSLTICGQQPITKMSWAWAASHGTLWAGLVLVLLLLLVCSPCSLRCRQFQFEILRSTRVGSKKWESLKIFTASQGRLWEFYVTFYGADVIVSRCCWHSSAGFRRQRLTQFVLEMRYCTLEIGEFFEPQLGQLTKSENWQYHNEAVTYEIE